MDLVPGPELAVGGEVAERPAPVLVDDVVPLADLGGALHLKTGDDTMDSTDFKQKEEQEQDEEKENEQQEQQEDKEKQKEHDEKEQ